MAIDRIGRDEFGGGRNKVGDDLVAEEVKVDPLAGRTAFGTPQHAAVKGAGGVQIIDRKGDVKGRQHARHEGASPAMVVR